MSKRLRPLIARAAARGDSEVLSNAIEAVQLAHEASLVHDDVIDNASTRRGKTAFHVENGLGAAIVKGDALLARGYALAIGTGSPTFASAYAHAIEMTIAGEVEQAKRLGDMLTMEEYEAIIAMKSGDLIALAFATQALLDADRKAVDQYVLGRRLGGFYQMVDDLLDYLPHSNASKPAFGDYRQKRWTWPLHIMGLPFGLEIEERLSYTDIHHCITVLQLEADTLLREVAAYPAIRTLIEDWMTQVRETAMVSWVERRRDVDFSKNSKSFSFAAKLLPQEYREAIQSIYAFCRFTDDLVDDGADMPCPPSELLDWWEATARKSHEGTASGIAVIDDAMRVTPDFKYPAQLIAGMRMDVMQMRYSSMKGLRMYTHRVAGVVGQWLTSVFGVETKWVLERADELGHAMQLTNILRDVGEDWKRGRIYLPQDRMKAHGVTEEDIRRVALTGEATAPYRALMDELMQTADASYKLAREAIPHLPLGVQRAIAAAANIYQGIHESLRANHYNNGTRRARTSFVGKVRRALPALLLSFAALALPAAAFPNKAEAQLRDAWMAAANDKAYLPKAWAVLREVDDSSAVHMAYRGSLELLESRYGSWPPSRVKRATRGFRLLDEAVARDPLNREVRYIRFMSYRHLPGVFKKKDIVREDSTWLDT